MIKNKLLEALVLLIVMAALSITLVPKANAQEGTIVTITSPTTGETTELFCYTDSFGDTYCD